MSTWNERHILKIRDDRDFRNFELINDSGKEMLSEIDTEEKKKLSPVELRKEIEPWLTALFQSEHLSLLAGAGISAAVHALATGMPSSGMDRPTFTVFHDQIDLKAKESAKSAGRGNPNLEDTIRTANILRDGLEIFASIDAYGLKKLRGKIAALNNDMNRILISFVNSILKDESNIINSKDSVVAADKLMSFLISFASRSATRERLNVFTTNYDRILEYGAELAGIRFIDRFVGSVYPIFRSSRLEVDMHYNPPGIRGEPRYLEGVSYFTKLHGSLDWVYQNGYVRRISLPFAAEQIRNYLPKTEKGEVDARSSMIYPNAAKDRETSEYPYVELFRDFASAVSRPNSTLVIYGYSFGDEHINRIIEDMLTIPSTHLMIISYNDEGNRIKNFYDKIHRVAQISLMIGSHFGDLATLIEYYLPKPAIDRTTFRMADLLRARGITPSFDKKEDMSSGGGK